MVPKSKKKVESITKQTKSSVPDTRMQSSAAPVSEESKALVEMWKHEVSELENVEFATMDEALNVIIGKVLDRFGPNLTSRKETHEFLVELLSTDPGLQDELCGLLKIKEK